jgi:hypothetical protein
MSLLPVNSCILLYNGLCIHESTSSPFSAPNGTARNHWHAYERSSAHSAFNQHLCHLYAATGNNFSLNETTLLAATKDRSYNTITVVFAVMILRIERTVGCSADT